MKWFKHDSDANTDAKLCKVRLKYGMEGYGLYWYCIELIVKDVSDSNLTFELEHDAEIIAHNTGIHFERVEEMMKYMVDLALFESNAGVIRCMKILKRLDKSMSSKKSFRDMIEAAKSPSDSVMIKSDAVMTPSANVMQDKTRLDKTRLDEKIRDNTIRDTGACLQAVVVESADDSFEHFRSLYPLRAGSQPWMRAKHVIDRRLSEGITWAQLISGVKRYAIFCDATDRIGTEYVMQAVRFCGDDRHFLEPWTLPPSRDQVRQDKNINVAQGWLEKSDAL